MSIRLPLCLLFLAPHLPAATTYVDATLPFDRSTWEAAAGTVTEETFDDDLAQSDTLNFASGIVSTAAGAIDSPNHLVSEGLFRTTLRPADSTSSGYTTITFDFPTPVTAFGADFFSIAGTRQVSVQGTFESGVEAFDLRAIFIADGGLDQGFFGLTSSTAFSSITLIALGTGTNDAFNIDNVAFAAVPEPSSLLYSVLSLGCLTALRRRK